MKIRKAFQGTIPENKILDTYSESNTDTYSCNQTNKITSKSAIMVTINANKYINGVTAWTGYALAFNRVVYNVGNKFSLESDGTVKYTGSKPLKFTLQIHRDGTTTAGNIYATVSGVGSGVNGHANANQFIFQYVKIGNAMQTIKALVQGSTAGNIVLTGHESNNYTFLIVEEL